MHPQNVVDPNAVLIIFWIDLDKLIENISWIKILNPVIGKLLKYLQVVNIVTIKNGFTKLNPGWPMQGHKIKTLY